MFSGGTVSCRAWCYRYAPQGVLNFYQLREVSDEIFGQELPQSCGSRRVASTLPVLFAQDEEANLEEVVVTGSRLTKSNVTSSVPLVQIGAEEINSRGVARVEDVVNILPNVFVSQTAEVANGASGTLH